MPRVILVQGVQVAGVARVRLGAHVVQAAFGRNKTESELRRTTESYTLRVHYGMFDIYTYLLIPLNVPISLPYVYDQTGM